MAFETRLGAGIRQLGDTDSYRMLRGKDLDITEADALTSLADADLFLVDDDAQGTQASTKKITASNLKSYINDGVSGTVNLGVLTNAKRLVSVSSTGGTSGNLGLSVAPSTATVSAGGVITAVSFEASSNIVTPIISSDLTNASSGIQIKAPTTIKLIGNTAGVTNSAVTLLAIHDQNTTDSGSLKFQILSDGTIKSGEIKDPSGNRIVTSTTVNIDGTNTNFTEVTNLRTTGSSPGRIHGPTDNDLIIKSEANLIFQVDSDNDGTNTFQFKNGSNSTIASLTEAGVMTLSGITLDGNTITGVDDSSEFTNDDNHIMTSAAIEDKILSYSYITSSGTAAAVTSIGNLTGDVTSSNRATTISSGAVHGSMLNTDVISSQTALTSGLESTDDFAISDNGAVKKMAVSVLQDYMQSNLSFLTLTPSATSDPAAGVNDAIIIKEGNTTTVAGKVYYLAPNGTWVLANAGAEGTRSGLLGVAVGTNSTTNGMVVKGVVVVSGHSAGSAGVGKTIYLSEADGTVTTSAPSSVRILGSIIKHHTGGSNNNCEIYFNPDNFNGQAANPVSSSFTATKSYSLDGINDYAYATNMSGISTWGKNAGTYSAWINLDNSNAANTTYNTRYLFFWKEDDNHNNFIGLHLLEVTSSTFALVHRYRHGSTTRYSTVFMQNTSNHGFPFHRSANGFGTNEQRNWTAAGADGVDRVGHDAWIHIAVTWDTTQTYTYNNTTYTGRTKLYLNGELRNVGQGNGVPGFNQQATAIGLSARPDADDDFAQLYVGSLSSTLPRINMYIKDLAMWSVELDADAIAYISDKNSSTEPASVDLGTASGDYTTTFKNALVGWWQFENNGNDSSDNNNNLTFVGETTSQFVSEVPGA